VRILKPRDAERPIGRRVGEDVKPLVGGQPVMARQGRAGEHDHPLWWPAPPAGQERLERRTRQHIGAVGAVAVKHRQVRRQGRVAQFMRRLARVVRHGATIEHGVPFKRRDGKRTIQRAKRERVVGVREPRTRAIHILTHINKPSRRMARPSSLSPMPRAVAAFALGRARRVFPLPFSVASAHAPTLPHAWAKNLINLLRYDDMVHLTPTMRFS
jgi:hypothetical protein